MPHRLRALLPALILAGGVPLAAQTAAYSLVPYPRQLTAASGTLELGTQGATVSIAVDGNAPADDFAASLLVDELQKIDGVHATIAHAPTARTPTIVLARASSATGKRLLQEAGISFPAAAETEGYALVVNTHQAVVIASSDAGIFYGIQTLRQWIHPSDRAGVATADNAQIVDWPALRWRGVQIDMSRGPIPTLAAFERDIALLSEFKVNAVVLYMENTFAYKSLPLASAPGGAIDAAEAAELVKFAERYHVTVIPEQESFGHLHLALQEEQYQDLAELPYGDVLSPAVPASLDFISTMFAELAPAFPGPFFHIGADETAQLGKGRSAEMQTQEGAGPLYLNYLKDIDQRLQPYHRKILFWGDIAEGHPELLSQLPKDMIAVPWNYGVRASYASLIKPFSDAGLETWVAPGVSNWSEIYPDYNQAIPNITGFVADGRKLGSVGLVNTTWMDDGESMLDFTWFGLAYGAAVGWEDHPDIDRFHQSYDWAFYRADDHHFDQEVQDLAKIHSALQITIHRNGGDGLIWYDPFSVSGQDVYGRMGPATHTVRMVAEGVLADLAANRSGARRYSDLLDPVEFSARRFDVLGQKAIYAHYIATLYNDAQAHLDQRNSVTNMLSRVNSMNGLLQDMRDQTSILREQYRKLWLEGNTPYFLDNILVRYDEELRYWEEQARRFSDISTFYRTTQTLPPLIHPDLPSGPSSPTAPLPGGRGPIIH